MDYQQEEFFKALTEDRTQNANVLEKPSMAGAKEEASDKYSDQAHFIYELLQNADDALATSAKFILLEDKLLFAHNGSRRFFVSDPSTEAQDRELRRLGDINSITSIGNSNKNSDAAIGKFGVGFKAVFQYTATPHVYDQNVFFRIERYIVPIRIHSDYPGRRPEDTLFVFPFNHETYTSEMAFEDISEKLRSLDYPLLFLSNLQDISFEIEGSSGFGLYGKKTESTIAFNDMTAELIKLTHNNGENSEELLDDILWLFSRSDDKGRKHCVGFFVDENGHLKPKTHAAFCFFPTKETTGLNFIIHAPFLLNSSREGILARNRHNIMMISKLAELAADSLVSFKEIGASQSKQMIDDGIFEIIPYDDSKFSEVLNSKSISFLPFYTKIKEAFSNQPIIPSLEKYLLAANAYWGGTDNSQLARVFSNKQLEALTGTNDAGWAFASLSATRSAWKDAKTEYIKSIVAHAVTDNSMIDLVNSTFIQSQSVEWLHEFYSYLSSNKDRVKKAKTSPIFLDSSSSAVAAYDTEGQPVLFLPAEGIGEDTSGFLAVHEALLSNQATRDFIVNDIGIGEPSKRDLICNIILPEYKKGTSVATKPHFEIFFQYYQECSQSEAKSFVQMIRGIAFVLFRSSADEEQHRGKAAELYFPCEPLKRWFETKPKTGFVSFEEYLSLVGEKNKDSLIKFLETLGVSAWPRKCARSLTEAEAYQIKPSCEWQSTTYENRYTRKWTDRYIDGCQELVDQILRNGDTGLSVFLWDWLAALVGQDYFIDSHHFDGSSYCREYSVLRGQYEYYYRTDRCADFDSSESLRLKSQPWLIDANGQFSTATSLSRQTMCEMYNTSTDEALELCRILGIEDESPEGFDDDIKTYGAKLGLSQEEQRQALYQFSEQKANSKPVFPTKISVNPERRDDTIAGEVVKADGKTYKLVPRNTRTSTPTGDPREYLINQYTNDDEKMVCQICENEMPFRKKDGKQYYFFCREMFDNKHLTIEHEISVLALCPTCDAKWNEYVEHSGDEQTNLFLKIAKYDFDNDDSLKIPVSLDTASSPSTIRFTEQHLRDVQSVILAASKR
jgi:hypothetical protein